MSDRKLFAHELEVRLDQLLLLGLRQRSAAEPAARLEALPRAAQERVLHWTGVAAQSADDLGWLLVSRAAAQAAALGEELEAWARSGLDAYDHHGLAAADKALSEFAVARQDRTAAEVVDFAVVEGRLACLLQALEANLKVSRFGIRELERILFDFFAEQLVAMREKKVKAVSFRLGPDGKIACYPAGQQDSAQAAN